MVWCGLRVARSTFVVFSASVLLQLPLRAQGLLLKDYTTQDGLPDSRVAPIMQDREGYIWFGTQAGLTRYDGSEFVSFGPAHEIPGVFGRDIMQDHAGAIWFAYSGFNKGGVTRMWRGRSMTIDHGNGLHGDQVFVVAETGSGDVWVGTNAGVEMIHFADSAREAFTIELHREASILAMYNDREGRLWYATSEGLFQSGGMAPAHVFRAAGSRWPWHVRPYSFYEASDGDLWLGGFYGAYNLRHGRLRRYGTSEGLPERGVWCFREDLAGNFWVGTMNGLYRLRRTGERIRFQKEPSFGDGVVYDMCLDREGNLWFASAPGLRKLLASDLIIEFAGEDALSTLGIGPIERSADGALYFGSRASGLYVLNKGKIGNGQWFNGIGSLTITSILPESGGGLWLGLWRGGALHLTHSGSMEYTSANGLPSNNVHAIARHGGRRLLIGTSAGIAVLHDTGGPSQVCDPALKGLGVFDLKIESPERSVEAGSPDTVWAATTNGVRMIVMQGDSVISVATFPELRALENRIVYALLIDTHHHLWFGTDGAGLITFDGSASRQYTRGDGLVGDRVYALAEDSTDNIWIGTSSGLSCFDGRSFKNFTHHEGFGEIGVHGLLTDADGALWVSTFPGVTKLKPVRFKHSGQEPPLYLTDVQVDASHLNTGDVCELQPDPAVIIFRFAGLSFTDEKNVRYRYRLEGFDADWSAPELSREVRYTHLPPGAYSFHVISRSADGVWNRSPATFSFVILPPLWLRWWFIVAAFAVVAASVYAVYRYRLNKLLELERTRSRIAMDLHDDIGSSLTKISVMTEVASRRASDEQDPLRKYLSDIGDTARDLIDSLGDIVWAVDPKHDDLQNVISRIVQFGQELCDGRGIAFETELMESFDSTRLSPEDRRDIFLVFKEGIHNVVRHSNAKRARFRVRSTDHGALLELLDDGSGIPDDTRDSGHGLRSIRQRGERVGERFSIVSRKGEGTQILLEIKTG